jgi:hypothetical protein
VASSNGLDDQRLSLTLRTRLISEFRNSLGALVMFDIAGSRLTFGPLCVLLARLPGIEFAQLRTPARFDGPTRFRFKGHDYEVSLAHLDYRITAADPAAAASATEELVAYVKDGLAPRSRKNPDAGPRKAIAMN